MNTFYLLFHSVANFYLVNVPSLPSMLNTKSKVSVTYLKLTMKINNKAVVSKDLSHLYFLPLSCLYYFSSPLFMNRGADELHVFRAIID